MVAVGGGDVVVPAQSQEADGQAEGDAMTRGAFPVLTRDLSSWYVTSRTQWSLFSISQWPLTQAARDDLDGLFSEQRPAVR